MGLYVVGEIMFKPKKPCLKCNCKNLVEKGYCDEHKKEVNKYNDSLRPSARERGYDRKWDIFRRYYLRKYPLCKKCNRPSIIPHHIIELKKGGAKYDEKNILPVCVSCHNQLHDRFHKKRSRLIMACLILSKIAIRVINIIKY